ncbi:hypothetical protein [Ferruginibacter albus]|uniref:hypothetical protein n=1 Tax=Ferruginibacter albus TaxID=2875540 RepID=UPI001CC4366D|nr:hypothetical protein [Ferruginibacter albus]UAY53127.1 hypothetical protein K9M53_05485 [Ferruginibacter albus]
MKYILLTILGLTIIFCPTSVFAQKELAEGFFTSEANTCANNNGLFVSIKKYNPTKDEISNATKPSKNSPMNYLMAPFEATNISMYTNGFESKLYSLDNQGNVLWDVTLGYSNKSTPSPVVLYNDNIFSGESAKDEGKITIKKIDLKGKVLWQTELDSLNNVNAIYVDDKRVSALVSFDVSKKTDYKNGTFGEHVYPIYFFVQFDITTGKRLSKEYQKMANYLSSIDYLNPVLNSDYSYFLNNKDSAIFLNTTKLESATLVSEGMSKDHSILKLAAGNESYHLLTLFSDGKGIKKYKLISDFYGKNKKYESEMPVDYTTSDRAFIYRSTGDSVVTVIGNTKNISILYSDIEGRSTLYKKIENVISPVIAAGSILGRTYILQIEGRIKPGTIGRIKLDYY